MSISSGSEIPNLHQCTMRSKKQLYKNKLSLLQEQIEALKVKNEDIRRPIEKRNHNYKILRIMVSQGCMVFYYMLICDSLNSCKGFVGRILIIFFRDCRDIYMLLADV
ncbi:hypothetical protein ACET3Z_024720 [Daucus carota]